MGEREDEQALKLNETMDEFSSTVNQCLSQLSVEMQKVEQSTARSYYRLRLPTDEKQRLKAELGRLETRLALSNEEKEMLHQQSCASQQALKQIRHEAHLFRDKMLVDAKTLCQHHVNKVEEMNNHYQGELQRERSKLHASNNQYREKLEQEAIAYQKEMTKNTEQSVQTKLKQEITKIQKEMSKVIDESAASRDHLKAQYEQEIQSVRAAWEEERAAGTGVEQAMASMRDAGGRQLQELESECKHLKEQHESIVMQMRSVARAFTLSGTVQLEDVEWHDDRQELFDQLMDDCAGECAMMGDRGILSDGSDKALPGLPEVGIPPLAMTEVRVAVSDDGREPPRTPPRGHSRFSEYTSPMEEVVAVALVAREEIHSKGIHGREQQRQL
eukprot:4804924-Amphidinium_carterae.4